MLSEPPAPALMLCGHGSRDETAVSEFANFAAAIAAARPNQASAFGYLEFATPIIRDGLDRLVDGGAREIHAAPGMLFAAGHAKNDIPSVLNAYQAANPGVTIRYGRQLAIDLKMLRAARERIETALADAPPRPLHETLLVVVGRGASDPDANGDVAKVARMLWEGMGFGWGMIAYSGVTFPLVAPALEQATKFGFPRIVVFPYFLFSGVLVKRIYDAVDQAAADNPKVEFLKSGYLNDHPLVIETMLDRFDEIGRGETAMNCQLCKYREQFIGFEDEVGLRQESHHHHVEGGGHRHHHDHHHGHGHDHSHGHHHPYPHADHPMGPRTLKAAAKG